MRTTRAWRAGLLVVALVYLHDTLRYLTMLPRVNVDEPWLMERAYQVMRTGIPSQPMLGLQHAYLLQVGYGYLLAAWMAPFGVGILQARLLGVALGLGIIAMVAWIGRRTIDSLTGLAAALFLSLDSNFLGGVRNARTDIPSVFFVTAALAAYLLGRQTSQKRWFVCAGASLGLAVLCHGNAFWAGFILLAWFLLDYGRRALVVSYGYAVAGGLALTFGPYLATVLIRWHDVQEQIGNFAADRVPGWRPSFVLHQMGMEVERYRGWYFGLVTNTVPNPLLWAFQLAAVIGIVALAVRTVAPDRGGVRPLAERRGPARLLILTVGCALIFAGFINNKVPVYLPHLLVGLALAAGYAASETIHRAARILSTRDSRWTVDRLTAVAAWIFILGYGAAGVAYYEKWYASAGKSELVPYEATAATLRTLVPAGPKYLFASPQFWPPFHDEPGATFYSYAASWPIGSSSTTTLAGVSDDRPIFLIVDEYQWLQELTGMTSSTSEWQRSWLDFIERRCVLDGVAYGTAHGTLALFRCGTAAAPAARTPRIVGGARQYSMAERVLNQGAADLAQWPRYQDPRRTAGDRPDVRPTESGLRIEGSGWPGIVKMFEASPGERYLVRADTRDTRDGDLLYLGTWQQPQVRSLAGASSSGIPAPLIKPAWFPRDRAFEATAPAVRVLVYSEAPSTDFVISSLDIYRLRPVADIDAQR
jgi:4-amino-4-deoxy-L-arabinose transferase-like glycosyltransferase